MIKEIKRLRIENRSAVVDLFVDSFYDYPLIKHMLQPDAGDYRLAISLLMGFWIDIYLLNEWPLIGIKSNRELVAAAILTPPNGMLTSVDQRGLQDQFRAEVGDLAYTRMEKFERESERGLPESPHYFLGILGVSSNKQRQGYGATLLKEIRRLSDEDILSSGVCLTTEIQVNVAYYQRHGYHVLQENVINNVASWCMYLET